MYSLEVPQQWVVWAIVSIESSSKQTSVGFLWKNRHRAGWSIYMYCSATFHSSKFTAETALTSHRTIFCHNDVVASVFAWWDVQKASKWAKFVREARGFVHDVTRCRLCRRQGIHLHCKVDTVGRPDSSEMPLGDFTFISDDTTVSRRS